MATSEVVTNALVHGHGRVDVGIEAGLEFVRVEVGDDDPRHPAGAGPGGTRDAAADTDENGRGLLIVDAVTSSWGVSHRAGGGKNVWFEVPVQP